MSFAVLEMSYLCALCEKVNEITSNRSMKSLYAGFRLQYGILMNQIFSTLVLKTNLPLGLALPFPPSEITFSSLTILYQGDSICEGLLDAYS